MTEPRAALTAIGQLVDSEIDISVTPPCYSPGVDTCPTPIGWLPHSICQTLPKVR